MNQSSPDGKAMSASELLPANSRIRPVSWVNGAVELLDQRLLPDQESYVRLETAREVAGAIRDMLVRGAPAIGIAAAYGVVLAARQVMNTGSADWQSAI